MSCEVPNPDEEGGTIVVPFNCYCIVSVVLKGSLSYNLSETLNICSGVIFLDEGARFPAKCNIRPTLANYLNTYNLAMSLRTILKTFTDL